MIEPSKPLAARQAGWGLLTQCVKYAYSTDLERREYFQTLSTPTIPEDFHLQLAALVDLSNHGRELSGFEYDIFPLLTKWLQDTYSAARAARRQVSRGPNRPKSKAIASGQDKNFSLVFALLRDVIRFNFRVAGDDAIGVLMDKLLDICMNTSVEADLRACISIIDAIVTFGTIPNDRLKECIHVLSSIHCLVTNLQKDAWHTLSNICKSHHGQSTVRILIDVLRTFPTDSDTDKDVVREVRGALSVLTRLLSKSTEKGYPPIPMTLLVDGLVNISRSNSTRMATDILKLINSLLEGPDGRVAAIAAEEDWSGLFRVSARCGEKIVPPSSSSDPDASMKTNAKDEADKAEALQSLISRVEHLLRLQIPDFLQRDECISFLTQVQHALPDSAVTLVLDHFKEQRSCFPSEVGWDEKLKLVLEGFFRNRNRLPLTRLQALATIREIYDFLEAVGDFVDTISIPDLIQQVLFEIDEESDTLVLQDTVAFVVAVAAKSDMELFDEIVDSLKRVIAAERSKTPISMPPTQAPAMPGPQGQPGYFANQSLSNVVTRGYVQMFMQSMNTNVVKSRKTFNAVVHIARSNACETDARLTALKLLFRLRADWDHRVYLVARPESEGLARSLYRTEASLARKLAEDAAQPSRLSRVEQPGSRPSRGISFSQAQSGDRGALGRAVSGAKHPTQMSQRLWSLPDLDALPEDPPSRPSPVLFSRTEDASRPDGSAGKKAALNTASLLETVLSIFHHGCDWEVYSFILIHLPAQLSNHTIFADAITQIHELRKIICELIRTGAFQEPPSMSGLRRSDVANCLFHSLAMIMSYHPHFQKSDEDEIVRTFMHGIADKTAKTCIHALSVCCHELPMSISKLLVSILHKMSQVITQPFVSMHILEFLACLSRLHSLYSNFREEEYRIVFGICFRYLQYVRDKQHSSRGNYPSEPPTPSTGMPNHLDLPGQQNPTDDLPQYVYALAYHVITFWFLALRINDRPNQIGLIAKNLFTDVDGSASNDEQAQITMDFMQRVAFTDANDTTEDRLFNEEHFGEMMEKRWIIGNSIVTIKQAKETAWAQVTRRYPSGISCFTIRENFGPVLGDEAQASADAARDTIMQSSGITLPSFLLLQLVAPIPQAGDPAARPIPLPADEAVDRAIRLFDRNSTVDGHKVGVIYIGEGQTDEGEILANTMGSPEYVELLEGLGTLTRLKGATFNTQGLDREYDSDGKYTFCWRDRVTEIVFHVTTQMPTNLEQDPRCNLKKRHIGNDFVNIIFNESGLPFKFDTFPSEFNYVNIVVTPNPQPSFDGVRAARNKREEAGGQSSFFMVQVMSKPGFPEISPAAEPKMVSLKALPSFIRLLAVNASVFSHVWANREGGEHISSWRARLREINRLRERYGPKVQPAPSPPPSSLGGMMSGGSMMGQMQQGESSRPASSVRDSITSIRRSSVATYFTSASTDPTSHRSSILTAPTTDNTEVSPMSAADALVDSVDFSKWT